jgi:hypothetical protein
VIVASGFEESEARLCSPFPGNGADIAIPGRGREALEKPDGDQSDRLQIPGPNSIRKVLYDNAKAFYGI